MKILKRLNRRKTTMAYVIGDDCLACGACQGECSSDAIIPGDSKYEIDPEKCISCGACADICPAETISEE